LSRVSPDWAKFVFSCRAKLFRLESSGLMRLHLVLPFLCVATMVHAQPTPAPPDPTIPKIAEPVCAQSSQDTADPTIPKITDINEACIALSGTQLHKHKCDSGLSPRFFKNNQFDSKAYAAHRSRIEVIDYDGRDSARNPRIVVPRNVTDQDTVYLRLRGSPLQYSYRVSYSTSALPARELTVVAGAAEVGVATAVSESFTMGSIARSLKKEFGMAALRRQSSTDLLLYGGVGGDGGL